MGNNDEGKSKSNKSISPPVPTAYYGPRVAMPPHYNSAVASGHGPPPYMWGPPQAMMPPYGTPYATIYPHGGVYAHPAVPLTATPVETPTKSAGNKERGSTKRMKGFDGLAMSIGNGSAEKDEGAAEPRRSLSGETDGTTDGSDGNSTGTDQSRRKRSREGTATIALDLRNPPSMNTSLTTVPCGVMPPEVWMQNERELKRERRKQSNRESARRSRLRKQAETEDLARKVDSLSADNAALRSEVNQLTKKSEKLRLENATLVEGLKKAQLGQAQEIISNKNEDKDGEMYEKKSGAKLHQLLDASPRTDAVAAS